MTAEAASLLGVVIDGRYRIDRLVGQGGFGTVYAAWHIALDIPIAVKVLKLDPALRDDRRSELLGRFLDEARVLTRLKHPHIVSALDLGTTTAQDSSLTPYLVMEWCAGSTLKELIAERGKLPLAEAYEITERLADALGHAHAMGVTHRDLKPANVMMVEQAGQVIPRLIDFGIAKLVDPGAQQTSGSTRTASGERAFTPAYAAPEQVAGARTGPWTDVHALGLLFIAMVTGEKPYGSSEDCNLAVIDTVRPSAERPGLATGAFAAVVARAVAARPQERFADARALRDAMRAAAREELGEMQPPSRSRPVTTGSPPAAVALSEGPAAPSGSTYVTEQATSATTPPRQPSAAPSARELRRIALLVAIPVALAGIASVAYFARESAHDVPSLAATVDSSSEETQATMSAVVSSSVVAPSNEHVPTFCELPEEEKKNRARATGLRGYGWNPSPRADELTSLLEPSGPWLTVSGTEVSGADAAERMKAAKLFLSQSSEALDLLEDRGIAYAMQGACLLSVRGRSHEAARVLGVFVGALPIELRGDSFGGPSAIPFAVIASAKWDGTKAKALSGLSEAELVQRVRASGVDVTDARRVANALMLSIQKGTWRGTTTYHNDPNIRDRLPGIVRRATGKDPAYWAMDRDVAVIAFGPKGVVDDHFLGRVLKGLSGARTVKATE